MMTHPIYNCRYYLVSLRIVLLPDLADLADFRVFFALSQANPYFFCEFLSTIWLKKPFSLKLFFPIKDLMMALSITESDIIT